MSTSTTAPGALARLTAFGRSDEGRPALLGFAGAILIALGGLGAGSTRQHDPLLESMHLSWFRFGHGLVLSSILLWTGVALMLIAWLALGRRVVDRTATDYTMIATTGFWLAPLLLSVPVFSRDTYSYLAQGALLRDGLDPYLVGPVDNPNSLLDNVSPIWTTTTAPYGPAFILVAKFVTMIVGDHVVEGTMLLRLCMLPGLVMLIWAAPRVARHVGANSAAALWICVLNPLVIIHLMGGVHNEMLMVGLMMAAIALTFERHPIAGVSLIALAVAVKATAGLALPFMVWVWMRQLRERHPWGQVRAWLVATAASGVIFTVVFAVVTVAAGVGLGWLTALAGSVKIVNWLTIPTAVANLIHAIGGLFTTVSFYAVLDVTRIIGIAIIAISLPLLWWRFRHTDREALIGIALVMAVVVLFVPAALPWYYTWPLAIVSALAQSRSAVAAIAGFSTWIMVIFKPDGSHGMYSWLHVILATGCAVAAWYSLAHAPEQAEQPESAKPAGSAA
ncbi:MULTISPECIES: alpha-(1-_6)-mannopyranosyltransferase A [Mycobacteriaceae]|jgi:alpha-1,6-mannosyltransferase|uniref:Alpha-(1->6)-mannopyranosyltransferase A n=1 Tax=Mycolicibacterium mucogenicum TaxID=56689 RepID=A0A4R5WF06_MYCMU|nr:MULTISPECIES: alpha-(1->6)-mannopyranosyltransferase A [Mycolicibacterium]TDK88586.1 alpha-(1->6)-mannopyranosyltransferase A [Mycolicibacterium mucogenicum]TXH19153.1 MAG: alpha-(1->6)-mannopyranosyltransferase A [Mycobacterium sp.]GCA97834.1 membrane protein [Mycolicibacterium sp. NCC-Tsukiji]